MWYLEEHKQDFVAKMKEKQPEMTATVAPRFMTMNMRDTTDRPTGGGVLLDLTATDKGGCNQRKHGRMVVNLSTGRTLSESEVEAVPEPRAEGTHPLQHLKIAGQDCLIMYDTGSSNSAVTIDFANLVGMPRIDCRQRTITVAGNTTIMGSGTYGLTLGPDWDDGKYYQLDLVGVESITDTIQEVKVSDLADGIRSYDIPRKGVLSSEAFPTTIGGKPVDIVIGVKTSYLFPHQVYNTQSGVVVSKSKLVDKNGSRVVVAGNLGTTSAGTTCASGNGQLRLNAMTMSYSIAQSFKENKDDQRIVCGGAPPNHARSQTLAKKLIPENIMAYIETAATFACGALLALIVYEWLAPGKTFSGELQGYLSEKKPCTLCHAIANLPARDRVNFARVNGIGERLTYEDSQHMDIVRKFVWRSPAQLKAFLLQKAETHTLGNHSKDWW